MDTNDYIQLFLDESNEHLQAINDNLLKLEKQPGNLDIVSEIFRSAHTLKGMAGTMEYEDITSLTHKMENVLDKIRNHSLEVSEEVIDVIFEALEDLEQMVGAISKGEDGKKNINEVVLRLEKLENGSSEKKQKENTVKTVSELNTDLDQYQMTVLSQAREQGFSTFQITIRLAENCLLKAARVYMVFEVLEKLGEVIKSVPAVDELEAENFEQEFSVIFLSNSESSEIETRIHKVSEVQKAEIIDFSLDDIGKAENKPMDNTKQQKDDLSQKQSENTNKSATFKTIRVSSDRIDYLMNLFEELVLDRGRLDNLAKQINNQELDSSVEHISRVSKDMQNLILSMRMVPVEQVFNRFPRMVRGLAKDLNKQINLEIVGADTELDRTVIDEIGDPLVHLIRNSVDHGIESPKERAKAGKPGEGHLILRAFHSGNHVFIEIEDDGAGINRDKVAHKAIENGLITNEQAENLKNEAIDQLILSSGFSTAEEVSDISGRGVGLDAVSMKIQSLGGNVSISSEPGKGSTFSIELPLTLSILSILLVKVQDETYGIPLSSVIETVLLEEKEIMYSHRQKVMDFRGKVVPLLSLQEVFNVPDNQHVNEEQYEAVVIISKGDKLTGLIVDSFIGKKEVVLKSLGNYLKNVYGISGATILGNGEVSMIIDPNALIK